MRTRQPDPNPVELAIARRLGLDEEQVIAGSIEVEFDNPSPGGALVTWRSAKVVNGLDLAELMEQAGFVPGHFAQVRAMRRGW